MSRRRRRRHHPDTTPAHVAYALMAISVVTAFPIVIAAVIAWLNRGGENNYMLRAHYNWLINTFWVNLLLWIIGSLLTLILVGWIVLAFNQLWLIYRVAAGWYYLSHERMP